MNKQAEYEAFRRTRRWHEIRVRVAARDQNQCQACLVRRPSWQLELHHLTYRYGLDAPYFALIAVCRDCHRRLHAAKNGCTDPWDYQS